MDKFLTDNDTLDISTRNYAKLSNNLVKAGYVEGKTDGQNSTFQTFFDIGYENGFKMGFELGSCHGANFAREMKDPKKISLSSNPSRGECQICINKELINENVQTIIEKQTSHNTMTNY